MKNSNYAIYNEVRLLLPGHEVVYPFGSHYAAISMRNCIWYKATVCEAALCTYRIYVV
jgi:hypothetical protein